MSNPFPIFGSQNLKDDDAEVIDSYDIETDAPPKPMVEPIPIPTKIELPRPTRLLAGSVLLTTANDPQLLLAADNNRIAFRIWPFWVNGTPSPAFNDYCVLAEDIGLVANAKANTSTWGTIRLRPIAAVGASPYELNDHTGPIWIAPGNALTGPIELTWMAITK